MMNSFDVVVVGGGPAGCVTAKLLAENNLKVALINKNEKPSFVCGESLPPQATPVIRRLGLEPLLKNASHIVTTGNLSAFGSEKIVETDFIFSPYGLGWHLDRKRFNDDLFNLCENINVSILNAHKVDSLNKNNNDWTISLTNCDRQVSSIKAQFLVDATGRNSHILKHLSIKTLIHDRLACRCVIYPNHNPANNNSLIESAENGWWYSAGIPDYKRVIMYFSDTDCLEYKAMKNIKAFNANLNVTKHVKNNIDKGQDNLPIMSFTAQSTQAEYVSGENWLAVGDAAISYDPLSSQGIWQALLGAEMASKHIIDEFNSGESQYNHWITSQSKTYWKLHQQFYAQEQRWNHNKFWRRRHIKNL